MCGCGGGKAARIQPQMTAEQLEQKLAEEETKKIELMKTKLLQRLKRRKLLL